MREVARGRVLGPYPVTLFGILLTAVAAVALLTKGKRGLIITALASSVFIDTAAFVVAGVGITGFHYVAALAILAYLPHLKPHFRIPTIAIFIFLYAIFITIAGPTLWSGTVVVAGESTGSAVREAPIAYSTSAIGQLTYLAISLAFIGIVAWHHLNLRATLRFTIALGITLSLAALVLVPAGLWPSDFFDNSPSNFYATYAEGKRARSFFSEPSHLGVFAALSVVYYGFRAVGVGHRIAPWEVPLAIASILLFYFSMSGTAVSGLLLLGLFAVLRLVFRVLRGNIGHLPSSRTVIIGLTLTAASPWWAPSLAQGISSIAIAKQAGRSLEVRAGEDLVALHAFFESYGLGVGLGNTRASSLLVLILASLGLFGLVALSYTLFQILKGRLSPEAQNPEAWALVTYISSALVSMAILSSPLLWALIATVVVGRPKPGKSDSLGGQPSKRSALPDSSRPSPARPAAPMPQ